MQNDKLEELRLSMGKVRDLFRDPETTEFVIVTIPTVMNHIDNFPFKFSYKIY